jgi:tetratricopeptide (TPR) repeat protein
MKCLALVTCLSLLSACTTGPRPLGTGIPSLDTARAALQSGAPAVALKICLEIIASGRHSAAAMTCEGDALVALNRADLADKVYTVALQLDSGWQAALMGLGRLRLRTNPQSAEALFHRASSDDPRNTAALNDLGIALDMQGRHQEAQAAYGKAIAADPDMRSAQVNLGLSLALGGRPAEGVKMLAPIADDPNATARERHDLAAALAMQGNSDEAARLLSPDLRGADLDAALAGYQALLQP